MQSPCATRQASSIPNVGASGASAAGTTSSALAVISVRRRPMRSEIGPHSQAPSAIEKIRTETVSPARAGPTPKLRPSSGRIAWVEYIVANMPDAPSRNPARATRSERSGMNPR